MIELSISTMPTVRRMKESDLAAAAAVHAAAFPRQGHSLKWLECSLGAFPKTQCFVAEREGRIVGVALWTEKSGFRAEAVLELEQIAVQPEEQGKGIGTALIVESLPAVESTIKGRGARLKHILVNTRTDNHAQRLYARLLGAKVEAVIPCLFSGDEAYMVARDFQGVRA